MSEKSTAKTLTLEEIHRECLAAGAYRCGVVRAEPVAVDAVARFSDWLAGGNAGEMHYLERYDAIRRDPRLLLDGDGAKILIVTLFAYEDNVTASPEAPYIAHYALGDDYHDVLRRRLKTVCNNLRQRVGGKWRVCVDSAPLMERYWAARARLGVIGVNGCLIVPGVGANFFIATIVTTAELPVDAVAEHPAACCGCGRCVRACPGGALRSDGTIDARRCLSYLTIEYDGEIPDDIPLGNTLYGCDICRRACPMASAAPAAPSAAPSAVLSAGETPLSVAVPSVAAVPVIEEFAPRRRLLTMTDADWLALTPEAYAALTARSAMRRVTLAKLQSTIRRRK